MNGGKGENNDYSFLLHINTVRRPFVQAPFGYFAGTLVERGVIKWSIESWFNFNSSPGASTNAPMKRNS